MTRVTRFSAAALLAVALTACGGPKAVRGGPGTSNPNLDNAAMSTGLDREDLNYLHKENMDKLQASRAWASLKNSEKQSVVAIWPIKNDTTEHIENQLNTLLATVESQLVESGVVQVVSRERQREMADEVRVQQGADFDPATAARVGRQIGADLFMTGKVQAVDERADGERRVQYTLTMQLLDPETSRILFQNTSARTKAIVR